MYVRQVALRSYGFGMRWNTEQEDAGDLLGNRYSGPGKARLSQKDPTERRPDILLNDTAKLSTYEVFHKSLILNYTRMGQRYIINRTEHLENLSFMN
jgi:hypothetical protein